MISEFMPSYRNALARYTDTDFETFFDTAGIVEPNQRSLAVDFLGIAGAFYLRLRADQDQKAPRNETLKQLKRAQKASHELADSLAKALQDPSMIEAVMNASMAARQAYPDEQSKRRDSFQILDLIFPLSGTGQGFRYEGLARALNILAKSLSKVEADAIKKPDNGRVHALRPWCILMLVYWLDVFGEPPKTGHYDRETAEYSSAAIAGLAHAAQRLDSELSSRLIVKALGDAITSIQDNDLEGGLLLTVGFSELIASGEARSSKSTLLSFTGMPEDIFSKIQSFPKPDESDGQERAIISKDEFFETLKSSDAGEMMFQALVEKDDV